MSLAIAAASDAPMRHGNRKDAVDFTWKRK
jgi:hypothetical protein